MSQPGIAVELIIRVTLLLVAMGLVAFTLQRQSASIRHLVWSAALAGALALGILVPWAPRLDVPVWRRDTVAARTTPVVTDVAAPSAVPGETVNPGQVVRAAGSVVRTTMGTAGPSLWLVGWLTGTLIVALWGVVGRLGLARLGARGTPMTDSDWRAGVDEAAWAMGANRPIRIVMSDRVGAPVTWGIGRPMLVVPTSAESWSGPVRRSVIAHEVAHIARNDYLHQLIAYAACALYWFHPLAWSALRRLRQAAERACDDLVLAHGTSGEDYAAHLIGVARGSRALRLAGAVAIGMARPSTLEGRIVAVLDPTKRRGEPTRRSWKIIGFSTLVALVAFGAVQPAPVEARGAAVVLPEPPTPAPLPNETVVMPAAPRRESRAEHQGQGNEEIVRVSPGERLDLDLDAGGSVTIRSWDENRVSVRCRLSGESWRDIATSVERVDGGVLVRARYTRRSNYQSSNNEFEIRVPRQFDVRIASAGGSLTIIGVEGRFTGHTGGGGFILDDLRGSASLTTGGGEIRVSDSNLSGRVSTGGGTVMLSRVSGGLRGSSGSGPVIYGESGEARRSTTTANGVTTTTDLRSVDVRDGGSRIDIGRNSAYRSGTLNITKAGGDIELNAAPNGAFVHTGGGDVRVGEAGGDVDAGTGGGNVTVGPASGSVRAGTGAGEVRIIVDRVTRGQVIEASSGFGRVIIELPRDFEGTFDLETAHTESHERTARIRSDWSLDEQPLTGWDDRQGTPRRYLRATKQVGSGGARVIVRTVNGEIEVRRR